MNYTTYFLIFLLVLGVAMYMHTAFANTRKTQVSFFGNRKSIKLKNLILICFGDGVILGFALGYLAFVVFRLLG